MIDQACKQLGPAHKAPAPRRRWRRGQGGFTFIEILIVIVIVGILSAIILPTYQDSTRKARRADARSALAEMASLQEQYFGQNNSYTTVVDAAGTGLGMDETTSTRGYYDLSIAAGSCGSINRCYVLTATATDLQTGDTPCARLTLDSVGRKGAVNSSGQDNTDVCW